MKLTLLERRSTLGCDPFIAKSRTRNRGDHRPRDVRQERAASQSSSAWVCSFSRFMRNKRTFAALYRGLLLFLLDGIEIYRKGNWALAARRCLGLAGKGVIAVAGAGTVCAYFGAGSWYLENAAYWVPTYLALAIAGSIACVLVRAYRWACAGLICACTVLGLIVPCYMESPNGAQADHAPNLRILQVNVFGHHGRAAALMDLVRTTHPDVVLLQEADEEWEKRLRPLEALYPHKAMLERFTKGGCDLGQYWCVESNEPETLSAKGIPAVLTKLHVNGCEVWLLNVHLSAPFLPERARRHREEMRALTEFVKTIKVPVILAGDLNSGPWSPLCRAFQQATDLVSVRQGLGILGTWPSFLGPLRVGIDQMFVSPGIRVVQCRVGPGIGSDHRPFITDLYVPPGNANSP